MRIIAGQFKGRRLKSPKFRHIRPAQDQVKGAVFNILFDVTDAKVLDLFAGTGSIGLEALSRGAKEVTFVDNGDEAIQLIRENVLLCIATGQVVVINEPVEKAVVELERRHKTFDLIFVDPPYEKNLVQKTLQRLVNSVLLTEATKIIVEHSEKEPIPEIPGLELTDTRKYGQTLVSFLRRGG